MEDRKQYGVKGRPPYEPGDKERRLVEVMVAGGFQQDAIAWAIGISKHTLEKHFPEELKCGGAKANGMVVANLYKQATKDDPRSITAAIFWVKTRLGWKDNTRETGGYLLERLESMSDDELKTFIARGFGEDRSSTNGIH